MKNSNAPSVHRTISVLLFALASLTGAGRLAAQAVTNFGEGFINSNSFPLGAAYETRAHLASFTTGSTAASFDFTGIDVAFWNSTGSPSGLTVELYGPGLDTNNINAGADFLSGLTLSAGNPFVAGTASFSGSATLLASTTYYLFFETAATFGTSNYFSANTALTTNQSGLAGWTIGDSTLVYFNGGTSPISSGGPYGLAINASAVPEPSSFAMLAGLGALGLVVSRRRRP